MLVLSGRHFRRQFRTGPAAAIGISRVPIGGTWPGARRGVRKWRENVGKIRPPIFFWVVYTHFSAFRAAIQKMIFFCTGALRGRLPPGPGDFLT